MRIRPRCAWHKYGPRIGIRRPQSSNPPQLATLASMRAPAMIICVDCGGTCHLLAHPEVEFEPGDPVAYRCADCMDRWDIVMPDHDDEGGAPD